MTATNAKIPITAAAFLPLPKISMPDPSDLFRFYPDKLVISLEPFEDTSSSSSPLLTRVTLSRLVSTVVVELHF